MSLRVSPLNKKLVLITLALSAFFSVLVSLAQVYYSWLQRKHDVEVEVRVLVDSIMPSIARSVWAFDQAQTLATLQILDKQPGVGGGIVKTDGVNQEFAVFGDNIADDQKWKEYPIVYNFSDQNRTIGVLKVLIAEHELVPQLIKQAIFILVTNAIKGCLLAVLMLFLFEQLVTKHIRRIVAVMYRFDGVRFQILEPRGRKSRDEIDFMIDAFNDMQAALQRSRQEEIQSRIKAAEEAEKSLGLAQKVAVAELATSVLHDINNIMVSIAMAVHRAKADRKSKSSDEVLEQMTSGIEKSYNLIAGIIHTQQELAGGSSNRWDTLSISSVIRDAVMVEHYSCEKNGITITVTGDTQTEIVTKKNLLITVLVNLLKNARESIAENTQSTKTIAISVKNQGNAVAIIVKDSGIGVDQAHINKMFQRGFTTKSYGHGFGLSGCAKNLHAVGATISIHSNGLGHGAEVSIVHPMDACSWKKGAGQDSAPVPLSAVG